MAGQPGFFDLADRYESLSAAGDPRERLVAVVDFEVFRGPLVAALRRSVRGKGGRRPFDPVLMLKILVLQELYSLSDEATEFQIKDRLSFQLFLGLGLDGTVPDATTVWLFRERLVQAKAIDKLFARFDAALKDRGYLAMGGQIIDATVVPAPKQRHTEAEKAAIKEGRVSPRAQRDEAMKPEVLRVFDANFKVYGVRKVWRQMQREGFDIARCTVERLMRDLCLQGVIRGKPVKTTVSDKPRHVRSICGPACKRDPVSGVIGV